MATGDAVPVAAQNLLDVGVGVLEAAGDAVRVAAPLLLAAGVLEAAGDAVLEAAALLLPVGVGVLEAAALLLAVALELGAGAVHRASVVYTISAWLSAASTPPIDRHAVPATVTACVSAYAPLKHRM